MSYITALTIQMQNQVAQSLLNKPIVNIEESRIQIKFGLNNKWKKIS